MNTTDDSSQPNDMTNNTSGMTSWFNQPEFIGHMEELRSRLMGSIVFFLLAAVLGFYMAPIVIEALKSVVSEQIVFVQLAPGEALITIFKTSLILGLVFSSPVWLFHLIRFISPGLLENERLFLGWITTGGMILFAFGVVFSYFLVLPSALGYLMEFGQSIAQNQLSITRYTDFCILLIMLTGVMFELPMVLFLLAFTNIITADQLVNQWRTAVVTIVVLAALLTPSQDPVTLLIVSIMLSLLYLLSLFPIKMLEKYRESSKNSAATSI